MEQSKARQERASQTTSIEHSMIVDAMFTLERALASPAPGRELQWKHRAGAALAVVVDCIRQHVDSAEGDGGLVAELEVAVGKNQDVRLAIDDHRRLREESEQLLSDLSARTDDPDLKISDVRARTSSLTSLLREHQWREVDLILGTFGLDVGPAD
jgi:hypothetical protein